MTEQSAFRTDDTATAQELGERAAASALLDDSYGANNGPEHNQPADKPSGNSQNLPKLTIDYCEPVDPADPIEPCILVPDPCPEIDPCELDPGFCIEEPPVDPCELDPDFCIEEPPVDPCEEDPEDCIEPEQICDLFPELCDDTDEEMQEETDDAQRADEKGLEDLLDNHKEHENNLGD